MTNKNTTKKLEKKINLLKKNLNRTISSSSDSNNDSNVLNAYCILLKCLLDAKKYSEVEAFVKQATPIAQNLQKANEQLCHVFKMINIDLSINLGRLEEIANLVNSSTLSKIHDNDMLSNIIILYLKYAMALSNNKELKTAVKFFERKSHDIEWAISTIKPIVYNKILPYLSDLFQLFGIKFLESGNYRKAIEYLEHRLSLNAENDKIVPDNTRVEALKTLGIAYFKHGMDMQYKGKNDIAFCCYCESGNIFELFNDIEFLSQCYQKLGELFILDDQFDKSEEAFKLSDEVLKSTDKELKKLSIFPIINIKLTKVRIIKIVQAENNDYYAVLGIQLKNIGNILWPMVRTIKIGYMWGYSGSWSGSTFSLTSNESISPDSQIETKHSIWLPNKFKKIKIQLKRETSFFWEPKVNETVYSDEIIQFNSSDKTYSILLQDNQRQNIDDPNNKDNTIKMIEVMKDDYKDKVDYSNNKEDLKKIAKVSEKRKDDYKSEDLATQNFSSIIDSSQDGEHIRSKKGNQLINESRKTSYIENFNETDSDFENTKRNSENDNNDHKKMDNNDGVDSTKYEQYKNSDDTSKSVFISYNHKDKAIVDKIKSYLDNSNIEVTIDSESMEPGESIERFIENSINKNDVILSIVSKNSLLSAWVAMETMNTISAEKFAQKKLIPCYIDSSFFDFKFARNSINQIQEEINQIKHEMRVRIDIDAGIEDLQDLRTRYFNLKTNIASIINRIKNSKCINLTETEFINGMTSIIKYLK